MAHIKNKGLEITTDLSQGDLDQLNVDLPRLGPIGDQALEVVRKIAAAAEKIEGISLELKLSTDEQSEVRSSMLEMEVERLPYLSGRTLNRLKIARISTLGQLVSKTESELYSIKFFGLTSFQEVKRALDSQGFRVGELAP